MSELRRRGVLRMAALYVVAAWLVMQVAEVVAGLVNLPGWVGPSLLAVLALGFPIALAVSWFYELTPGGFAREQEVDHTEPLQRVSDRRIDFVIISMLAAAVLLFAWDKWRPVEPGAPTVAVLPFENLSGDPKEEYFSDGIAEELLNVLAHYPGLRVAARTSSFQFKRGDKSIAEIADALNVAHVVEGSVRRSGDRLRITAQLVNAADGYSLWSQTFDRRRADIFEIQDDIAHEIGAALRPKLTPAQGGASVAQPSVTKAASVDAYDLYLEGRALVHGRDPASLGSAIRLFERALRLDASFAPAHVQLAIAALLQVQVGSRTEGEAMRLAASHLRRARELGRDLAELEYGEALLAGFEHNLDSSVAHAREALAMNPNYSDAITLLANTLDGLGRYREADAAYAQVLVADPLNVIGLRNQIARLDLTGRTVEAHQVADRLLALSPVWAYHAHSETSMLYEGKIAEGLGWALQAGRAANIGDYGYAAICFGWIGEFAEAYRLEPSNWGFYLAEGRFDEAIAMTQRGLNQDPDNVRNITSAAIVLYNAGRIDEARPLLERALDLAPEGRPIEGHLDHYLTMILADARRRTGDEEGAQAAAKIVRDDYAARVAAGRRNENLDLWRALIAAFDGDADRVIASLRSAIHRGLREDMFTEAMFDPFRDDPRFIALHAELDAVLAEEHEKVLQLVCFNNPIPDDWRPLPETCEGVAVIEEL